MKHFTTKLMGIAALIMLGCNGLSIAQTILFSYTGGLQSYTVPAGITSLLVDASGAAGGSDNMIALAVTHGGCGGRVQGTLAVTPGEVLNIVVGQRGGNAVDYVDSPSGGFNGGARAGHRSSAGNDGGGGGATDIRIGGTSLTNRILVAGAGGGAGNMESHPNTGGNGGGLTGGAGWGFGSQDTAHAGQGGTPTAGGEPADFWCGFSGEVDTAQPGNLFSGGYGACSSGGGGGGYYGGGGGGWGGGGGGSSYTDPLLISSVTHTQGYNCDTDGYMLLTPFVATLVQVVSKTGPDLLIAPNPSRGLVNVICSAPRVLSVTVRVTNLQGQEVSVLQSATNQIVQLNLVPGVYLVSAETSEGKVVKKIVVE